MKVLAFLKSNYWNHFFLFFETLPPIFLHEVSPTCLPHTGGLNHQNSSLLAPTASVRRPESQMLPLDAMPQ